MNVDNSPYFEEQLDPGIADYVVILNDAGVKTLSSCQGGGQHHHWKKRFIIGLLKTEMELSLMLQAIYNEGWPLIGAEIEVRKKIHGAVDVKKYPYSFTLFFGLLQDGDKGYGWYDKNRQ